MADSSVSFGTADQIPVTGFRPPKVFVGITLDGSLQRLSQSELLSALSKLALDCGAKVEIESFEEDGHGKWNLVPEGLAVGGDEHMMRYLEGVEESEDQSYLRAVEHSGKGRPTRPKAVASTSYTDGHRTSKAKPVKARKGYIAKNAYAETEEYRRTSGKVFNNDPPNCLGIFPDGTKTVTVPTVDARKAVYHVNKHSTGRDKSDQTVQENAWDAVRRVFHEGTKLMIIRPELMSDPGFYGYDCNGVQKQQ